MVKANTPTLYPQLKKLPWTASPRRSFRREHGHARAERRTVKVIAWPPAWPSRSGPGPRGVCRRPPLNSKKIRRDHLCDYHADSHPGVAGRARRHYPQPLVNREPASPSKRDTTTFHDLAAAMRVWAKGLLGLEAAVELLIGHGTWLTRADFAAAALTAGRDGITGATMMSVDFEAALAARRAGGLPSSSSEEQILALAASIAAGVPVVLGDLVCGLDEDNAVRVAIAVLHAAGFGGRSVLVTRGRRR